MPLEATSPSNFLYFYHQTSQDKSNASAKITCSKSP